MSARFFARCSHDDMASSASENLSFHINPHSPIRAFRLIFKHESPRTGRLPTPRRELPTLGHPDRISN